MKTTKNILLFAASVLVFTTSYAQQKTSSTNAGLIPVEGMSSKEISYRNQRNAAKANNDTLLDMYLIHAQRAFQIATTRGQALNIIDPLVFQDTTIDADGLTVTTNTYSFLQPKSSFKSAYFQDTAQSYVGGVLTVDTFISRAMANYACSWFNPVGQADNWWGFGPINVPTEGITLRWQSFAGEKTFRDGYEVYIGDQGITDSDFNPSDRVVAIQDNAAYTVADSADRRGKYSFPVPSQYTGQQIYVAFRHNANDMNLLGISDVVITEGNVGASIIENENIQLYPAYPSPANAYTTFNFNLKQMGKVEINVYDVTGKNVGVIAPTTTQIGNNQVRFTTENLPTGMYHYHLSLNGKSVTSSKFVVVR